MNPARKTKTGFTTALADLRRQVSRERLRASKSPPEQPAGFWIHLAIDRVDYFTLAGARGRLRQTHKLVSSR
jgi:hypothetical protein